MSLISLGARFDWFSASVTAEPGELIAVFAKHLDAEPRTVRAHNGFQRGVGLFIGDEEEARVQWSDSGSPNLVATGYPSQRVYEVMAVHFPIYGLARADVAVDFDDEVFEVFHGAMRRLSHERSIKHHIRGDWETPGSPDGRTTYSGSRKSVVFRRLYEFAKHHGYGAAVRFEVEFKPASKDKIRYSGMGPLEMLRLDGYAVELLRRCGYSIERMHVMRASKGQGNAWFTHLVRQYGPKLTEYIQRDLNGDAARLGPAIKDAYAAELAHRRALVRAAADDSSWSPALADSGQGLAT